MLYTPNHAFSGEIIVVNSLDENFPIDITVEGELADYINIIGDKHIVLGPRGFATVKFSMVLPEGLETPGAHETRIYAVQSVPPDAPPGGFSAKVKVGSRIIVWLPYPEKFVDAYIDDIDNARVNQTVTFRISAYNRGNQSIENAMALIDITDPEGNVITRLRSDTKSIEALGKAEFAIDWLAENVKPGQYVAEVNVTYDGEIAETFRKFLIGAPTIKITSIESGPIPNGSIARIDANIESEWNLPIEDVFAEIIITNEKGYEGVLTTPTVDLQAWEKRSLQSYWDTSGAQGTGNYTALVIVHYLDNNVTASKMLQVIGYSSSLSLEMILLLAAAIIVLIVLFLIFRRKKKKNHQMKLR